MKLNHLRRRNFRNGSIYVATFAISMLTLVIGMSGLLLGRIQLRTATNAGDFVEARMAARTGIEMALLSIYDEPYWRTRYGNGAWFSNKAIGGAFFSVAAADPVDGDVTRGENNPVILTSTGIKGNARYVTTMRLEVSPRTGSALEVGICAGDEINTDASTLTSDQTISSNNKLSISNAGVVNASSEAYKSISGSGYTPTPKVTGLMREMPVPATVLQYYTRQGTEIPITTLPAINHNELIANTKFEIDTSGWYPVNNSVLSRNTNLNNVKEGLASLKVSGRITAADAVATDLPVSILAPGRQFQLSFPVFTTVNANFTASMTVRTDAGEFSTSLGPTPVLKSIWGEVKGTVKPTWTGTPYQVTLTVMSSDVKKEYYLDKVSTTDITFPKGDYLLERHLISPTSNPFGATNPQGIYVINCAGKNLVITNSRIIGTIVLIKPGQDTEFAGSVLVEPAVANFPGILSDSTFKIALDPTPLSENSLMANFNPVGAPYPYLAGAGTTTNTTITDVYPSVINGLVYAGDDLNVSGDTRLNGLLVCQDKVQLKGGAMTIKYNSLYLNNPPPGFHLGTIEMKPVPGTWQRSAAP